MPDPHPGAIVAIDLDRARFRSNPRYELVLFDHLPPSQQALLADLRKRPDFYGVLRPVGGSAMTIKSVARDTALLVLTMKTAGPLPAYARDMAAADAGAGLARLVLDEVLEVDPGGGFVSGAQACEWLYGPVADRVPGGRLQGLSTAALRYGEALAVSDPAELSLRLYGFHRLPVTQRWREAYPDAKRVAERLRVDRGSRRGRARGTGWRAVDDPGADSHHGASESTGWLSWVARRQRPNPANDSAATYKLYVSPMPELVDNVFAVTFAVLADTGALQIKVGADAEGLLRPDKIVAYFDSLGDLRSAADTLRPRLHDCPAHGVPFTAALDDDGLLSWGVDPPASVHLLEWQPRESWRLWLTNRLANALLAAKRAPATAGQRAPWQYALDRVRLEGIDIDTWTPRADLWQ